MVFGGKFLLLSKKKNDKKKKEHENDEKKTIFAIRKKKHFSVLLVSFACNKDDACPLKTSLYKHNDTLIGKRQVEKDTR